jgi:hypothetical protein
MEGVGKENIHIFTNGSPEEAAVTIQKLINRVQVGPIAGLKNLGDESFIWRSGIIRFRKGNFVIEVVATRPAIAEKLSAHAAEAVPKNSGAFICNGLKPQQPIRMARQLMNAWRDECVAMKNRGVYMEEEKTFDDFVGDFLKRHTITGPGSGTVIVNVTEEELKYLGRGILRLIVGWGEGLEASRDRRRDMAPPERFTPEVANENEQPRLTLVRQNKTVVE